MDIKEEFLKMVDDNRLDEARIMLDKLKYDANEDPFYYANMGWILNHMERYQEAEIILRKGLLQYSHDGWMYSQLGYCLDRQGKIEDGFDMLMKAYELGFDEAWLHGEIGWCYKEKQEYKKAIEFFENGLMEDDHNVFMLSQAAIAYMAIEDYERAEEYFKKSYQYQSDNDGLYDLANFYHKRKNYQGEIEYLEMMENKNDNADIVYELGVAYYELGEYGNSLSHIERAMELGKDDTGLRAQLGDLYLAMRQKKESDLNFNIALGYYEKALKREGDTYWIYQEMIWIAHKQKDLKKKLSYLHRASEKHDMTIWLMYHYARCYSDMGEHKKAVDACKYCLDHGETSKEFYDLYAWNLGRCDMEEEAINILEDCIKKYDGDDWNYGELGWNYAQIKNYERAKENFLKALVLCPDNVQHTGMLGWCYIRLDNLDEAQNYTDKAIALGRDDGWIHSVRAEIYQGRQDYEHALHEFQYALDHDYDEEWIHKEIEELKKKLKG